MTDDSTRLRMLLRQQAAIASFGTFALREDDLLTILTESARVCADGLNVPFCKVSRYRSTENDLLVEAGYGWKPGVVGNVVSRADESSPQGRAFITGLPSICNDRSTDVDFELPAFYAEQGIVSTIDVVIKGADKPYGVLEIDNNKQHNYDQHDIDFLTGFANVLAEAVKTFARTAVLQRTIATMTGLVEEKDRLLEQKNVLAAELQHRVRNNLQLVYGMLERLLEETVDNSAQRGIRAIARRVTTLAQVYDHLLGTAMTRTPDFGKYLTSLCLNLAKVQSARTGIGLTCSSAALSLDLDTVTALGIVVAEIVTNSYDHAFPASSGSITVTVTNPTADGGLATIVIGDNGIGFEPTVGSKRHGIGLVRRLLEQVGATSSVTTSRGTNWTINFLTPPQNGLEQRSTCSLATR